MKKTSDPEFWKVIDEAKKLLDRGIPQKNKKTN